VIALQLTFPYERVKAKFEEALSEKYEVTVGSVERGWVPGRVYFNNVAILTRKTKPDEIVTRFDIKRIEIDVGIMSLIGGTIAALGLTVAAVHASVMLARTAASESDAKARIKSLIAAQNRYRSASPTRGFACDLNELGVSFDAPAQRHAPPRRVAGVHGAVTQALAGDYAFTMNCSNEPTPKRSFALFAIPKRREGPGRWVYCAEADGRLRMIKRRSSNLCLTEGRLVLDE